MERNQFYQLLHNFTSLTPEEAEALKPLKKEFPFSQVIHGLLARVAQDNQWADKENWLQTGAVYSSDRAVLKSIVSLPKKNREIKAPIVITTAKSEPAGAKPIEPTKPDLSQSNDKQTEYIASLSGDSLYNEVMHDIEILKERKLQFEQTVSKFEKGIIIASPAGLKRKSKSPADPDEGLLLEIKNSKKKIKPEGPKQKEQIEIIDQFIKTQPSIKGKITPTESVPKEDLSDKNISYGDNIVSETLVEILLKQGKKEKAIEVLKKLIWKFPQKKAYFAAQIEDLKKK